MAETYWFVGASYDRTNDQTPRFLADGIWENGYDDRYLDQVKSMRPGQRIAIAAISDGLFHREYPELRRRYGIARLGDAYVLTFLYAASSGTSHSALHALADMFRAAADGRLNFV